MDYVLATVRGARELGSGMAELFSYCRERKSDTSSLDTLEGLDFQGDAQQIAASLSYLLGDMRISKEFTGFYFGLDGLNMRTGKGIEVGLSKGYRPDRPGTRWVEECNLYPGELPSDVLSEMYASDIEQGGLEDYVLCLGYAGLALHQAFETIPVSKILGGATRRAAMWGFHDGDLFILGEAGYEGFRLLAIDDPDPNATAINEPKPVEGAATDRFFKLEPSRNPHWSIEFVDAGGPAWNWLPLNHHGPIAIPKDLKLVVREDGPEPDVSFLFMMHLLALNRKAAEAFQPIAGEDIVLTPVRLENPHRSLKIATARDVLPALDFDKSSVFRTTVKNAGEVVSVSQPVLRPSAIGDRSVFAVEHCQRALFVSAEAKQAIEETGLTGIIFQPVLSTTLESQ